MTEPSHSPTTQERNAKVDRLLHDAEHAKSGAMMARMMVGRIDNAAQDARDLMTKYHHLLNEAQSIDPTREAPAWSEADV